MSGGEENAEMYIINCREKERRNWEGKQKNITFKKKFWVACNMFGFKYLIYKRRAAVTRRVKSDLWHMLTVLV